MAFYYPEGFFGPVCDVIGLDDGGPRALRLDLDADDGLDWIVGPYDASATWPRGIRCKFDEELRIYYDCEFDWGNLEDFNSIYNSPECFYDDGRCFNLRDFLNDGYGLNDTFFTPEWGPEICVPSDDDINIRPVVFVTGTGLSLLTNAQELSNPLTFPVTGSTGVTLPSSIICQFSRDGRNLIVSGNGFGNVTLKLTWDDNPDSNGVFADSISILGTTWNRSGESGSKTASIAVEGGQSYAITYTNLNPANNPIKVIQGNKIIALLDGDGSDYNGEFKITGVAGNGGETDVSLWNADADKYAVWVNPAECTLPCLEQSVEYEVYFPTSDVYFFEFGADDIGSITWEGESAPFHTANTGNMINPALPGYTGKAVVARPVTAGNHKFTIKCTNAALPTVEGEAFYINDTLTWGDLTLGPGTAIRSSRDGYSNTSGSGHEEALGFQVPGDSPFDKYLSFGTIEATTTTITTRTATISNVDLTNIQQLKFFIIAGTDDNGGERPNDIDEVVEVRVQGGDWFVLKGSKQYYNITFAEYDATHGTWYRYDYFVDPSYRVENATIEFRAYGDTPEIGGEYLGLNSTQFAAQYANCSDFFGLYKIIKESATPGDCGDPGYESYQWSYNPGGWYLKICRGAPCSEGETLPWVRSGPHPAWIDLMDEYAVWPSTFETFPDDPKELEYAIYLYEDDNYTLEYAADNVMELYWDGVYLNVTSSFTSVSTSGITAQAGLHILKMIVTNNGNPENDNTWSKNPAGGAWILKDSSGNKIRSSADLSTINDNNLIWHTRMATTYQYI